MTDDAAIPVTRRRFDARSGTHVATDKAHRFVKGPIPFDWLRAANALPGKAGAIGLALWFLKGVKQANTFAVTREVEELAACTRQAFARGLNALAQAGLITVETRRGARPVVTLIERPPKVGAGETALGPQLDAGRTALSKSRR